MSVIINLIFKIISSALGIYFLLCTARIILTWIPGMEYNKVTRFLVKICDPYLNIFRGLRLLRIGSIDFSPALGLIILSGVSSCLSRATRIGRLSVGYLAETVIEILWTLIAAVLTFLAFLLCIRLLILILKKDSGRQNPYLRQIDYSIGPFIHKVASIFTFNKRKTFKSELIITIIFLMITNILGTWLFNFLGNLLIRLPF